MNITQAVQKKIPKFTKEQYYDLFEEILRDELFTKNHQNSKELSGDIFKMKSKKHQIKNSWAKITNACLKLDVKYSTENKPLSILHVKYLQNKCKEIIPKIVYISSKYNRSIEYVLRVYFDICSYEIKKKKPKYSIKKRNVKSLDGVGLSKRASISSKVKNTNEKEEEDLEENKENQTLTLFFGNFDMRSFLEHNQKVYMKKGENLNTFFFVSQGNTSSQNDKFDKNTTKRTFSASRAKRMEMPKLYEKKGAMCIHRFDSFKMLPCYIKDKDKSKTHKTLDLKTNSNYLRYKNFRESTSRDRNKKRFEVNEYKYRNINTNLEFGMKPGLTHSTYSNLGSNMPTINKSKGRTIKKRKQLKLSNFLTRDDLYY